MSMSSMSCEDQQIAYLEGTEAAATHVHTCATCQVVVGDLDGIRDVLTDGASWMEPDPSLESRVVAAVERAAMGGDVSAEAATPRAPVVSLDARRRVRGRFRIPLPALGLVAAALLLGAVLGGGLIHVLDRGPGSEAHVALASTPLAPRAHGTADLRNAPNGVEIKLHLSGLPRAPAGFYYQAWVKGDKGLVPIGTFHTGDGEIVLWSGVPLDRYHTITVTLEDEGGDPGSSGKRVLVGELRPSS